MNPIFTWIVTHTTMKSLARECAKCNRIEVVPPSKKRDTVACKHCGAYLPPKSPQNR